MSEPQKTDQPQTQKNLTQSEDQPINQLINQNPINLQEQQLELKTKPLSSNSIKSSKQSIN